jgi:hypothetical protein
MSSVILAAYQREAEPTPGHSHHAEPMAASLALPDGVTLSKTALICSRNLSFDEWKTVGSSLSQIEGSLRWGIGDWWHYGEHSYGERAKAVANDIFPRKFQTLANYGSVARSVEASRRREDLSYSHHCEVAKLPPEEQERWLAAAVADGLSVIQLRRKISEAGFVRLTAEQEFQRFLGWLMKAAEIDGRLILVLPWKYPGFEDFLERYFLTNKFERAGLIAEAFERATNFCSKIAQMFRRVNAATPEVRTVAEAEGEIEISSGLTEELS